MVVGNDCKVGSLEWFMGTVKIRVEHINQL